MIQRSDLPDAYQSATEEQVLAANEATVHIEGEKAQKQGFLAKLAELLNIQTPFRKGSTPIGGRNAISGSDNIIIVSDELTGGNGKPTNNLPGNNDY